MMTPLILFFQKLFITLCYVVKLAILKQSIICRETKVMYVITRLKLIGATVFTVDAMSSHVDLTLRKHYFFFFFS